MGKKVKLTEKKLREAIMESVKNFLNEGFSGYDNDLDYDTVYDEAYHFITTQNPKIQSWRGIAQAIGFRMETIGPSDMETLKDAIEDAMIDAQDEGISGIVAESIKKVLKEYGEGPESQKKLGALQARKVLRANGETADELFANQSKEGSKVYDYAKQQRSATGPDSDEFGNTTNPLYKEYTNGYHEYLNSHPDEYFGRKERLRKLGYNN